VGRNSPHSRRRRALEDAQQPPLDTSHSRTVRCHWRRRGCALVGRNSPHSHRRRGPQGCLAHRPLDASHSPTVSSSLAEAISRPFGLKATALTAPVCPFCNPNGHSLAVVAGRDASGNLAGASLSRLHAAPAKTVLRYWARSRTARFRSARCRKAPSPERPPNRNREESHPRDLHCQEARAGTNREVGTGPRVHRSGSPAPGFLLPARGAGRNPSRFAPSRSAAYMCAPDRSIPNRLAPASL